MPTEKTPALRPHEAADAAEFDDDWGLSAHWGERVITAVAVALGVTIVAAVALLMGMA